MNNTSKTDALEIAVHIIIVLLGIIVLFIAQGFTDTFWQPLLVNIGSSLVVVTILFAIFEMFRRRHQSQDKSTSLYSESSVVNNEKARAMLDSLKSKQQHPVATSSRKVNSGQKNRNP
jgi:protein-S-isoprenylcysteine O-methyltransferase Ste14